MTNDLHEAIALRRAESLTSLVQKELERMIVSGEIRPGERLNELALAQQFGVSRGPVREAMRALEQAKLVTMRVNQGFFVREVSKEETSEIYDVRAVVYGLICERLVHEIQAVELRSLESFVQQMDAAIVANEPVTYYRLNLQFHDESIRFARHKRAQQTYQSLINETHLSRQRSLVTQAHMQESNDEHKALVAAIKAGDAKKARHLGEQHALAGRRRWQIINDDQEAVLLEPGTLLSTAKDTPAH